MRAVQSIFYPCFKKCFAPVAMIMLLLPALSNAQAVLLTGVVWDQEAGAPVEGASVRIYLGATLGELAATTDEQGRFELRYRQRMNDIDYAIIINREGYHRLNGAVRLNYGEGPPRQFNLYRDRKPEPVVRKQEVPPGPTLAGAPVNNLIFLIDVSGSMAEQDRLENLKESLIFLVGLYRPEDLISIITYASDVDILLQGGRTDQRAAIDSIIRSLKPTGVTKGVAGLVRAYDVAVNLFLEEGNNKVILATDGIFAEDKKSRRLVEDVIIQGRSEGVSLSVFSFGEEAASISERLSAWSTLGLGTHTHIRSLAETKEQIVREAIKE